MELMLGDCLEKMKAIPDGTVDMVLCDLPYGTTCNRWDSCIPFAPLWDQWHRVCKPAAPVLLFGQMPFAAALVMSNPKEFRYEWVYEKTNPTGFLNARRMPLKAHESILVFYRGLPVYNPQYSQGEPYERKRSGERTSGNYGRFQGKYLSGSADGARFPRDVLRVSNASWGTDRGLHPTQKPVPLLEYLIRTYTDAGGVVMDNCMGSGSTGVACVNTGRDFIGIELDPGYFDVARKRIEEAGMQMRVSGVLA